MADFGKALSFILKNEGGYCNVKGDAGGPTNYGITQVVARANGFQGDMRDLPLPLASLIYRQSYWKFNGIQDQACATKILDMDVNDGLPSGVKLAQRAAVVIGAEIAEDGAYGPATEAALNACDSALLMKALIQVSVAHYDAVAAEHPQDEQFLKSWLVRANEVPNA
jgi:lysozyme family protein